MSSQQKSDFAVLCRKYRVRLGLKQKQVAERVGIQPTSYGNVESSPVKVIRLSRAQQLAVVFRLTGAELAEFLAAWERCPLSEFGKRRREMFEKRNQMRSKTKNYDQIKMSLVEVLGLYFLIAPTGHQFCNCTFGGGTVDDPTRSCEICEALEVLGIVEGFTTRERTETQLDKLYDRLKAERLERLKARRKK